MRQRMNYYKIGLFVIGSLFIVTLFVVILGAGSLFQKNLTVETYFDESIQGLDVGSIVKFRGVKVGTVKEITFVQDKYKLDPDSSTFSQGRYVLVKMAVKNFFNLRSRGEIDAVVKQMVGTGLRIKLTSQGLTGTSYLEIDYQNPDSNQEILGISWEPTDIYVPSTPSTITKIGASMDEFLKKLDAADIEKMAKNLNTLIVTLDDSLKAAKIGDMSNNGNALMVELRDTNKELKKVISNPKMQALPDKLNDSLTLMSQSMNKLNNMLTNNNKDISVAVENFRIVTEDLREVSNNAKKYPSMLLFGEAPKSSEMGKK
ncbi:MAG: MCE family protein [Leptospiraceae bacterium]|nr:MCE family protein [Leptospiraceae bacterium]